MCFNLYCFALYFFLFFFPFLFRYALMQECWATQLTARPALADVSRRLQAMHAAAVVRSGRATVRVRLDGDHEPGLRGTARCQMRPSCRLSLPTHQNSLRILWN
jgi:hypothetical protein